MGSPAKRMRILQSVEVDEENAEYIMAKQKQQQKLKSRFEAIFEKFGNMNESQSDEIDMKTNRVVVDRGHLRRIKRQVNGKGNTLLDTIVLAAGKHSEDDAEEEANEEDLEDELAPPQLVKSKTTVPPGQDIGKRQIEATDINAQQPKLPQPDTPTQSIPQFGVPQIPNTPNPAAGLLQNVQLPHTPAGTEAQSAAFYANLLQTINQAVYQFTAGLNTPNTPATLANAPPAPITPITTNDKVIPATDPKWFFPPLSSKPRSCPIAQSSPLPNHTVASIAEEPVFSQNKDATSTNVAEEKPMMSLYARPGESSSTRPRRSSPRVEIQRRVPRIARKHHFTHEDDVYISKRKRIDGVSWAAIKDGRQKWKEWPMSAFHNRWILIKDQNLHLQDTSVAPASGGVSGSDHVSTEEIHAISKPPHHLPTPSSSEHEGCHQNLVESTGDSIQNMLSSSVHYDDDDRDLLSLAGSDSDKDQPPTGDDDIIGVASQDIILPSIETRDLVDEEDTMLEDLPSTPQTQDFIMTPTRASSVTVKTEPAFSSPTTFRERKKSSGIADVIHDSQDNEDEDDMQDDSRDFIVATHESATNNRPSNPTETHAHHETNQLNTRTTPDCTRSPPLSLIDTAADDELLPFPPHPHSTNPTTPSLKRKYESLTPSSAFLLASYHTPKTRDVDGSSEAGTIKSTSKSNRRSFLKRIKRKWTRKGTPAKDSASGRRTSLGGGLEGLEMRKRKRVDDDWDRDELCIF